MVSSTATLEQITRETLDDYNQTAQRFRAGTLDHDVSQNIDALLRHIVADAPYRILDFGCGPGRDLQAFTDLGHTAIGLDGSDRFAAMARESSGCEVWCQNFVSLNLPAAFFDGVFANASLFHVPSTCLHKVLTDLNRTLKADGVLFSSNPRGENQEGWNGKRYGVYHSIDNWRGAMADAGFLELEHYYRPSGLPRAQQPWLASVWRKAPH